MSNCIVKLRVKELGFCCPFAYFQATRSDKQISVSFELGVSERTVRNWRKALRSKQVKCLAAKGCFTSIHIAPAPPEQNPPSSSS